MRIGLLDDNPAILDYLTNGLELAGHTVSAHTTGFFLLKALSPAGKGDAPLPYDLVILDLLLPGELSGLDVYRLIRTSVPADQLPIIFITAASEDYIQSLHREFPYTPLLHKPFPMHVLLQLIDASVGADGRR